ncbi:hypothetical protein [Aurantimonas sp. VKM B-3413]|nr:hypothetical protein [Aurantimonas sp. VKM B-3413]MCB8837437.1 hypothetical protein [Aurantimonas sp. VKM B-3413]
METRILPVAGVAVALILLGIGSFYLGAALNASVETDGPAGIVQTPAAAS